MHTVLSGTVIANNQLTEQITGLILKNSYVVFYIVFILYKLKTEPLAKAKESQRAGGLLARRITSLHDLSGDFTAEAAGIRERVK